MRQYNHYPLLSVIFVRERFLYALNLIIKYKTEKNCRFFYKKICKNRFLGYIYNIEL